MREIRFRAWDKKEKKMCGWFDYPLYSDALSIIVRNNGQDSSDFILMQYTGLHDKQGKEIYEGDIVRNSYSCAAYTEEMIEVVEYSGLHAGFVPLCLPRDLLGGMVIGNIYENSDILK